MHRFASAIALCATVLAAPADAQTLDAAFAERFGALALDCVHREYPNKIAHVLSSDADARPPRDSRLGSLENRIESLEKRADETNSRLESLEEGVTEMIHRQTESEMRVATELISVANLLREKIDDHHRVVEHERRIAVLEAKVG